MDNVMLDFISRHVQLILTLGCSSLGAYLLNLYLTAKRSKRIVKLETDLFLPRSHKMPVEADVATKQECESSVILLMRCYVRLHVTRSQETLNSLDVLLLHRRVENLLYSGSRQGIDMKMIENGEMRIQCQGLKKGDSVIVQFTVPYCEMAGIANNAFIDVIGDPSVTTQFKTSTWY